MVPLFVKNRFVVSIELPVKTFYPAIPVKKFITVFILYLILFTCTSKKLAFIFSTSKKLHLSSTKKTLWGRRRKQTIRSMMAAKTTLVHDTRITTITGTTCFTSKNIIVMTLMISVFKASWKIKFMIL